MELDCKKCSNELKTEIINGSTDGVEKITKLNSLIIDSILELYNKDYHLINNCPVVKEIADKKHHVGERAIVFRFAHYLQNFIDKEETFKSYNLDCEYNRNGLKNKSLPSFPNGTYPDVILHKRGSNDKNLLVMEFKTYWNKNQSDDRIKIQEFTDQKGNYKFLYGITVLITKKICDCKIVGFIDGDSYPDIISFQECVK